MSTLLVPMSIPTTQGIKILPIVKNARLEYTVDPVIFACLDFREFVILGFFTKARIRELSISKLGSTHNNNFRESLKFANLLPSQNSRKLKPREYFQIHSIILKLQLVLGKCHFLNNCTQWPMTHAICHNQVTALFLADCLAWGQFLYRT